MHSDFNFYWKSAKKIQKLAIKNYMLKKDVRDYDLDINLKSWKNIVVNDPTNKEEVDKVTASILPEI
jgi:hypothetical protein